MPDGLVDRAFVQQHAAEAGARLDIIGIDLERLAEVLFGLLLFEEGVVGAAEVQGGLAVGRVLGERLLEVLGGLEVILLEALVVELEALVEMVERRLRAAALELDLEADGALLAGVDGFLARTVGLVAHLHALDGVRAGHEALHAKRRPLLHDADGLAVEEDLDTVHVGFEHQLAELRRRRGVGLGVGRDVGELHLRVVAAGLGGRILAAFGVLADVGADVLAELVGGDEAVAVFVGGAAEAALDVVGEDAVSAAPSALSKDCSRSRLADRTKIDLLTSMSAAIEGGGRFARRSRRCGRRR